ncbi:ABC transporter ATP-binding protein [Alkalibacillus haloalkaliphilus]|uniref:ABC transporter ATP-binding protein n=1 Tax=Alkalibacillus haloalkaliphilus TaxID=94136 RepID=UPI002936BE16|nr:ATP-binding cassette domain-containing protein [Alkalibacillus haloalkaliphilus]MDV2583313.1 ATP-binding cassette domain-containing protein [Alkalibacillus haloalkaliphilus]
MVQEQVTHEKQENREVVLEVKDLGVSFRAGTTEDYKSKVFNLFSKKDDEPKEKEFWPLRNLDLKGYQGEILGIIGSNGSGKTTLCKLISGILKPDEGSVYTDGEVSALFSLGMGFNKELTGRENVYLNGMMLGIPKDTIDEYFETIHEFSGLGEFIEQPMKYYSSGMKARLGFSVTSHLNPEILILDEALNTGDAQFGKKAADKMKELVKQAKMVIIVTHSLNYAKRNCDRLVWLDQGEIKGDGDPKEVAKMYRDSVPKRPKRKRSFELVKANAEVKDNVIVKADDATVEYKLGRKPFHALKDLDFEIREGEVVGIIGHNGAGKSTLCKLLTNILRPDQGSILIQGDTSALLGYGTGFNAQLSGRDNIYLNGMLLNIPKDVVDRELENIIDFSGIRKSIDKPVKYYSSGMAARLGFSIAAQLKPDIFIIDEALSTGDMEFKEKASEKIQEMMESAKAVIIVSHSMRFVKQVCTRAIWMEQGQIMADGEAEEIVEQYKESVKKKG